MSAFCYLTMSERRSKPIAAAQAEHVHLRLESVLRLRPLNKKEKEDQIVLEPRRMEDGKPSTVVMHPMLAKLKQHPESPAGMPYMRSPEALHLCKDTEYHLHQIIAEESNQEKVYFDLGLPVAKDSMGFLKHKRSATEIDEEKTTNLIVCMGVEHSGKTHTCFGASSGSISKRRSPDDGLVPRILDSLFSQSTHHIKNKRGLSFGVRMSLLQVTQERTEQPKHHDDSIVQDLLLPSFTKATASPMRSPSPSRIPSVARLVQTLEKAKTSAVSVVISSKSQSEALVSVDQDATTLDFGTNAMIKTCRDITEARKLLASGLHTGQRFSSRNTKAHVLTILQPVLLASDGSTERIGGKIGVLDMAGIEPSSRKKRNSAVRGHKDSVSASSAGQNDTALNAVLHCVRSLQHNSMILSGRTPALDIVDGAYDGITIDDNTSEISCVSQEKTGKAKGPTFKMVPYRQHNLTMLLQPFFSARQTNTTKLTLLMAAYPGHRDHAEKKALLTDIDVLLEVSREPQKGVMANTGLKKQPLSPIPYSPSSAFHDDLSAEKVNRKKSPRFDSRSDQKRHRNLVTMPSAPTLEEMPSMGYSVDEDENVVPLAPPPPFAPTAPPLSNNTATAPVAPSYQSTVKSPLVVDFPGVVLPTAAPSPAAAPRAVMPHPQDLERSFEQRDFAAEKPLKATTAHNIYSKTGGSHCKLDKSPTKAWLSGIGGTTKNAIRGAVHVSTKTGMKVMDASAKKGMKMMDKMRTTPDRGMDGSQSRKPVSASVWSPPHKTTGNSNNNSNSNAGGHVASSSTPMKYGKMGSVVSKSISSNSPMKRGSKLAKEATHDKMKRLERENRNLHHRNEDLEARCARLEKENAELKYALGDNNSRKPWNKADDEAWEKNKKNFVPAPLIQAPLDKHMNESKQVFDTNGRYHFAVGKEHFSLQYPTSFKRASELDRRDQQSDEAMTVSSTIATSREENYESSGEKKRKSSLHVFQRRLDTVKRRKSGLLRSARNK